MEALPTLPPKPRDRTDRTVYRRGAMAVRVVNGVLRPACTVCFKRATFGIAPPVRGGRSVADVASGPRWCRAHAPPRVTDVANRRCSEPQCTKQRTGRSIYCGAHRTRDREERAAMCRDVREQLLGAGLVFGP